MVAFETVHSMKEKHSGKCEFMALKLDMSKASDQVEWKYLEGVMRTIGLLDKWIYLILICVEFVTYFVIINGKQCGNIKPIRGLKQGDSLSRYLFLLCDEGFSGLLNKAKRKRNSKDDSNMKWAKSHTFVLCR